MTVVQSDTLIKLESVIAIVRRETMPEAMRKRLIEAIEAADEGEDSPLDGDKLTGTLTRLCHVMLREFTGITEEDLAPAERMFLGGAVRDAVAEF